VNADELTCQALLNCLIREVSAPEHQVRQADGYLMVRLARSGALLRAELPSPRLPSPRLPSPRLPGPRPSGRAQLQSAGSWRPAGWEELAALIATELTHATGVPNEEFTGQVRSSHAALTAIIAARRDAAGPQAADPRDPIARYLASEQALVAGHRFHPAPKARDGAPADWLRFAPEAGTRFPLRFLGVRDDVLAGAGDSDALDRLGGPAAPAGYRSLPAHPWQLRMLAGEPWLGEALRNGLLLDLGDGNREVAATSSVRTVYDPAADVFAKFSLNVRLTNCVRTSAWYELAASVMLTGLLRDVLAQVAASHPGTVLLGEPGYRTAALAARQAYEGLAVIVRDGMRGRVAPGVTPLLAASLTEPNATFFAGRDPDWLLRWWTAYLRVLVPPVLDLLFLHGVVLEPHLQNVLVGVDAGDWPAQVIHRDLEGVKLVTSHHGVLLAGLPAGIAGPLGYDPRRGWDRVSYCLFVNHLTEIAAAIAGCCADPDVHGALWRRARDVTADVAAAHGWPPQLRAVLAGVPLPAKANLRTRWARAADRDAGYVQVPNPLGARHGG
jgi:siderophore synthetase component